MLDGAYDPEENYKENKYFANSWQSSHALMYPLLTEKVVRCLNIRTASLPAFWVCYCWSKQP